MGINFPNAPTVGQLWPSPAVAGQPVWQWDGEKWAGGPATFEGNVRYDTAQALTAAQMLQARQNIIAAPVEALGHGDICINGNMEVVIERAFDTAYALANGVSTYLAEQWAFARTSASAVFAGQIYTATSIDGFQHMIGAVATTAMGAPASGDYAMFIQPIEGFRWSRLSYALAWAKPITIGFWVFPTAAGTMHVAIRNGAGNRSYVVPVVLTGNTWNYKTVTIPGDVTGTWTKDNTLGANVSFVFAAGSGFQGAVNAWTAGNIFASSGQTNFFAAANSQVYLTGVTMYPGSDPIPQERVPYSFRPYPESMAECQRYYLKALHNSEFHAVAALSRHSRTVSFPVSMRTTPTRTRLTTGSVTNIRGSDPTSYFTANALDNQTWLQSGEAAAAGMCICNGFVEQYSARMI